MSSKALPVDRCRHKQKGTAHLHGPVTPVVQLLPGTGLHRGHARYQEGEQE
ncbi:hypothetical protein DPMN_024807 [Dreissena polymorpha]|uniref:Uncharacterized protein n=1 Tax=Dreissena polymorpha TaxID=45954 RepID=A0A9D4RD06_DREPO|nr:hypothetical protein DPMN_024807 [Dreissena polymorpha]